MINFIWICSSGDAMEFAEESWGKMKASGQRKRKVGEVSEENRKSIGAVAKKSANGSCKRRPKPAGKQLWKKKAFSDLRFYS